MKQTKSNKFYNSTNHYVFYIGGLMIGALAENNLSLMIAAGLFGFFTPIVLMSIGDAMDLD